MIELGSNHVGEIAYTTALVKPDVALVNNVAAAHIEGFGSMDGVKRAKGEIYQGLQVGALAIVNLDSNGGDYWKAVLADKTVKTCSATDHNADFYPRDVRLNALGIASFTLVTLVGEVAVELGIMGQHNVDNALAAAALSLEMGASLAEIGQGLAHLSKVKGRVDMEQLRDDITLIDDSYNASVPAMKAAVELLGSFLLYAG